jgi:hypothetical protein
MARRKKIRKGGLKVIHRHRVGDRRFLRVSELAFVKGVPKAILEWIDLGGVPAPLYLCDLDPKKLVRSTAERHTYYYRGETTDPRYEPVVPAGEQGQARDRP